MAVGLTCDFANQFVPLLLVSGRPPTRLGDGMCLVNNDQVRAVMNEIVAMPLALYEVDAGDEVREVLVYAEVPAGQVPFQAGDSAGANHHRLKVEFRLQRSPPLVAEVGRAQHANPLGVAPVEQLTGDESAFDCLAHAHVISNEQAHRVKAKGHDERHKLIRTGSN